MLAGMESRLEHVLGRSMGFEDRFRMSVHAVITDEQERVLLLRATYADGAWGLPGGAVDPGETVHETLIRECWEELGCVVNVQYLSGVYCHPAVESHALIFRCTLPPGAEISLSSEHSNWDYIALAELSPVQRQRVEDCLRFDGNARSCRF